MFYRRYHFAQSRDRRSGRWQRIQIRFHLVHASGGQQERRFEQALRVGLWLSSFGVARQGLKQIPAAVGAEGFGEGLFLLVAQPQLIGIHHRRII